MILRRIIAHFRKKEWTAQSGRTSGAFSDEIYAGRLFGAQGVAAVAAPNAPSWTPVTTQLAWRAYVSEGNVATAQSLLDATRALEAKVATHLQRHARR